MHELSLESDRLRLRLAPDHGACVLALEWRSERGWVALWRPSAPSFERANQTASYLLAPWSNRLRDGRFMFEGREHVLRRASAHALHGDVCERPWRVMDASDTCARLRLDARSLDDLDFPWPFVVDVEYALDGATLRNAMSISNASQSRMPAGLGFHPYFVRSLDGGPSEVELRFETTGVYPGEAPCPMLPTGPPRPLPAEMDFSRRRSLDVELDHCFAGWDGHAEIAWTRSHAVARLRASERCRHLVVYSPLGHDFFAFEPVTHANDGFNLAARGIGEPGVVVLDPGGRLEAAFDLTIVSTDEASP